MSVRYLPAVVAAALLGSIAVAAPAAAEVEHSAADAGLTSGRLGPTVTALLGLMAIVIGTRALTRVGRSGTGNSRNQAVLALVSGLVSLALGSWFAVTADGGPGTGNGIVGAWAAMVFGLIALVLGALTLNRSRQAGRIG
ncbi:DUF6223 family protein [Nocardia lijiangensis]|uniref:DUF6223 family protein n=1 Tax=Nocardia lijiangensis TaxID=299618 RepID=UPI003D70DFCB